MNSESAVRLLRRPEVEQRTGLGRSSLYAMMRAGQFPLPARIGPRAVAWSAVEVARWCEQRLAARDHGAAA